jgi:uncharacterized protein
MKPGSHFLADLSGDDGICALMEKVRPMYEEADCAHDFSHAMRVCSNARFIGRREGADNEILILAALLHDANCTWKCSQKEEGSESSSISISNFLNEIGVPSDKKKKVLYSIEVHRFSKGIIPVTLEAKILQDADRLDAMGAIGIARVFATGGALGRALYSPEDPFCLNREPNDSKWNVDHFFKKLLKLESGMHTQTARKLARKRAIVLKKYLLDLQAEIEDEARDAIEEQKKYAIKSYWGKKLRLDCSGLKYYDLNCYENITLK